MKLLFLCVCVCVCVPSCDQHCISYCGFGPKQFEASGLEPMGSLNLFSEDGADQQDTGKPKVGNSKRWAKSGCY